MALGVRVRGTRSLHGGHDDACDDSADQERYDPGRHQRADGARLALQVREAQVSTLLCSRYLGLYGGNACLVA